MLQRVLDPARWDLELIAPGTLTAELLDRVDERRPAAVCIAAIPPGGLAHTRYLCKRLRSRFPELKILVGRWGALDITTTDPVREDATGQAPAASKRPPTGPPRAQGGRRRVGAAAPKEAVTDPMVASLKEAGADLVAAKLLETRQQLASLMPVLAQGRDGHGRDGSRGQRIGGPRPARRPRRGPGGGGRRRDSLSLVEPPGRDSIPRDAIPHIHTCTSSSRSSRRAWP